MLVLSIRTENRLNKFVFYVGLNEQAAEITANLLEQAKHEARQRNCERRSLLTSGNMYLAYCHLRLGGCSSGLK
jgi:hypothetical protein